MKGAKINDKTISKRWLDHTTQIKNKLKSLLMTKAIHFKFCLIACA